jgi:Holliday junction resolvase RusA-like endonuclease
MKKEIFISGNVPSSKNGKRWTGKYLIHSKTVMTYIKNSKNEYVDNKEKFLTMLENKEIPYRISFKFHRSSRRKFDYINPCQTVQDLMVKYGWIEDDNCLFIIPSFEEYEYNKEKPGVTIKIL